MYGPYPAAVKSAISVASKKFSCEPKYTLSNCPRCSTVVYVPSSNLYRFKARSYFMYLFSLFAEFPPPKYPPGYWYVGSLKICDLSQ